MDAGYEYSDTLVILRPMQIPDRWLKISAGVLALALVGLIGDSMRERLVNVGDKAPNFAVTSSRGTQMTRANFGGKLLVLNFWATWCPPCIAELPSLNQMARTLGPKGVVVLGISVDQDKKAYDDFLRRFKLSFEVAHDPAADIASEYGTFKYPETYVITPDGTVVEKFIADRDWMEPALLKRLESHIR